MKKIFIILVIIFNISCEKEEEVVYQTIYPLPYLPVYPGSHWKYINELGDTIVHSTETDYKLHSYPSYNLYGNNTDPIYVPYWNNIPIYGYSTPGHTVSSSFSEEYRKGMKHVGWLSEVVGQKWGLSSSQYGSGGRMVVAKDTSIIVFINVYDSVIVVQDWGSQQGQPSKLREINYYAKNIGLIRRDRIMNDTVITKELEIISYIINR